MKIAVPSYHRVNIFKEKTLQYLLWSWFKKEEIDVFVVAEDEEAYKNLWVNVIVWEKWITNQRNFITRYYDEWEYIACFDDDLEWLLLLKNRKFEKISAKEVIDDLIHILDRSGLQLWWVYHVLNKLNCRVAGPVIGRKFICWPFFVKRNDKKIIIKHTGGKDDYEQSALSRIYYGATVRFENIFLKTAYNNNLPWWLTDFYKTNDWNKACDDLIKDFPQFFGKKFRKDWRPELRVLRDN